MLGTEMRPSSAISFESGLERGVPWGRDLITFMTSAAGYMMRTLQKPRKNKPSKRQVNHRRFLHNMIQRKFAEIEAANHQLASSLFSGDTESQRQSEVKWTHKDVSENMTKATAVFSEAETKHLDEDDNTRTLDSLVNNHNESSLMNKPMTNQKNGLVNQIREEHSGQNSAQDITDCPGEREQTERASVDLSDLTPITSFILGDSVFTSHESIEKITDNPHVQISNLPNGQQHFGLTLFDLSPASPVSPLSLSSCDFEVQIQPDYDHTSQHIVENLQMDLMENLELLDSEEYLQQIDQVDMAAVLDIHNEEDLSCFQDSLPLLNTLHTDFAVDKQASCSDGDICGRLQQITTLTECFVKNSNVEDELRTFSLAHCESSDHHNQARQTGGTVDCCINQPEISTERNKEGQYSSRGTWPVSELGNISSHVLQEIKHDLLVQSQPKNWEQHLSHYNHTPSKVKDPYYTLTDEDKKMIESGPLLNSNMDHSDPVNSLSFSTAHCYGYNIPLQTNSDCIGDSSNEGNQSIQSFEGVAQSFPAVYQHPHPHSVSTPPLNDDWLFSNIATEVDFNSFVRSYGHSCW